MLIKVYQQKFVQFQSFLFLIFGRVFDNLWNIYLVKNSNEIETDQLIFSFPPPWPKTRILCSECDHTFAYFPQSLCLNCFPPHQAHSQSFHIALDSFSLHNLEIYQVSTRYYQFSICTLRNNSVCSYSCPQSHLFMLRTSLNKIKKHYRTFGIQYLFFYVLEMNSYLIKITEIQDNEMKMYKLVKGKGEGEWQKVNVEIGYFENGKWSIEGIGSLSSRIIKWEIKELYLQNNFSKTILQQIQHIVLTRLQILQLMVNNITSIESLNSMFLPSLTEITLSKNNINSIRQIRKCKWPNIKHLQLYNNPITDLSSLCHADIQKLKSFWVADIQPENSCFRIAEIIKTNTSKLKMIMISIRKSTRKKYIHDMVVNRFGSIRIFRTPEIDF